MGPAGAKSRLRMSVREGHCATRGSWHAGGGCSQAAQSGSQRATFGVPAESNLWHLVTIRDARLPPANQEQIAHKQFNMTMVAKVFSGIPGLPVHRHPGGTKHQYVTSTNTDTVSGETLPVLALVQPAGIILLLRTQSGSHQFQRSTRNPWSSQKQKRLVSREAHHHGVGVCL